LAFLLAAKVSDLVARPGAAAAFAIIEVSAVWALGAALAWTVRVLALSSCGAWGARTRRRREDAGRRGSG
jgi:hypothetical protein